VSQRESRVTVAVVADLALTLASQTIDAAERTLTELDAALAAERATGAVVLVVVGETFFCSVSGIDPSAAGQEARATLTARFLAKVTPAAIVLGPDETNRSMAEVTALATRHGLSVFSPPKSAQTRSRADSVVLDIAPSPGQSLRLAVLGIPGDPTGEASAYAIGAQALRAHGADFVVGLTGAGPRAAFELAEQGGGLDALVSNAPPAAARDNIAAIDGKTSAAFKPAVVGGVLLLAQAQHGVGLGLLRLYPAPDKKLRRSWRFWDTSAKDPAGRPLPAPERPYVAWFEAKP
jgi:hypothetical protein